MSSFFEKGLVTLLSKRRGGSCVLGVPPLFLPHVTALTYSEMHEEQPYLIKSGKNHYNYWNSTVSPCLALSRWNRTTDQKEASRSSGPGVSQAFGSTI